MNLRVAVTWLERLLYSGRADDAREDVDDWLAGNDQAITARRNRRHLHAIALAGGEVG